MSANVSCFDDIIGLSRTPCSDYDLSSDYTTSDSGLFLDELVPLHKWESILNCKEGENVFTYMERARDNAIIDFRIDGTAKLAERSDIRYRPFRGRVGKVKRKNALSSLTVGNWYGIVLKCDDIVGGELQITDIGTLFDTTGNIDVLIYNNLNTLIGTYTVNTTANALANNAQTITLPMHSEYVENLEYYVVFQLAAILPYDNEFYDTCSSLCSAKSTKSNKQFGYQDYMVATGVNLTSVADLSDINLGSESRCFGLTLGIETRCKVEEIWCYDEMDYIGDPIDMAIAKAVRLKAASSFVRDIAMSENLNRDTVIDGVTLGEIDDGWILEYTDIIDFIIKNIDITKTDCFECGKELLMGVGNIRS